MHVHQQLNVCMQKVFGELFNIKCEMGSCYWTHTFQRVFVLSISWLTIIYFPVAAGNLICFWRDSYYRGSGEQEKEGHFQLHVNIFDWQSVTIWSGFYFNCLYFIKYNHLWWNLITEDLSAHYAQKRQTAEYAQLKYERFYIASSLELI